MTSSASGLTRTLLVANRGEIARRIFRTARRIGLRTVAVFSDADARAPFVREADLAIRIGEAPAARSYLDAERILAAARESGAELVHPGYGFLAERAAFAAAVERDGRTFVGPSSAALALLGDKAEAKRAAERAGLAVIPGYAGDDQRDEAFLAAAARTGYPVMIKPTAGGGGIGMQLVAAEADLRDALARARRSARAAFDDERLILERAIERPRHVEIQLLADAHGTVLALGERDCSAQRRHQKVLEETPSPALDEAGRTRMSRAAIALARAVDYRNAGTCEFLLDATGEFFFLEVNARLQVEHPVTELAWGIDLVEQQLRIAMGERVRRGARPRGHAIEARLYAEDPAAGFVPSTGRIALLRWPEGARVDSGIDEGSVVGPDYDPLLAKVIVHAADRASALAGLAAALEQTTVLGVRTDRAFLLRLVAHPAMLAGEVDTTFVERTPELAAPARTPPADARAVAAAAFVAARYAAGPSGDPWRALGGWRAGDAPTALVELDGRSVRVDGRGPFAVEGHAVRAGAGPGEWTVDGRTAVAACDGPIVWVDHDGHTYLFDTAPPERRIGTLAGAEIVAPMPGVVLAVHARAGQRVARGDLVCVIEAMKMELRVEAPAEGTIGAVLCAPGDQVRRGQRLAELAPR